MIGPIPDRKSALRQRAAEVEVPIESVGTLELGPELERAESACRALQALSHKSDHTFMAATALEHAHKVISNPRGDFAGVYRFNALANCDNITLRLGNPELQRQALDVAKKSDFEALAVSIRETLAKLSNGSKQEIQSAFRATVEAAERIVAPLSA